MLCDKGWKAIWDKLLASSHPNVQSSINVWCPPDSGIRERIEAVYEKYPRGYEAKSEKKVGTTLWDEAEMELEKYQRIQRAKRKFLVVLMWISILQKSQKKVLEKKANENSIDSLSKNRMRIGEVTTFSSEKNIFAHKNKNPNGQTTIPEDTDSSCDSAYTLSDDEAIKNFSEKTSCSSRHIRSSTDASPLRPPTNTYSNTRMLRRHTSIGVHMDVKDYQDVPSFILEEYGGVDMFGKSTRKPGNAKVDFKAAVNKVIAARRFMNLVDTDADISVCNLKVDHLPPEWKRLDQATKETLAKKLSFKSLSSWDFNALEIAELCDDAPLLFIGWAILGSPHAQRNMARDAGFNFNEEGEEGEGYDFAEEFQVKLPVLCAFLRLTESNYNPNPYHNSTHAADVLATTNSILQLGGKNFAESNLHMFSLLVAAIIHDVQHPGEQ